MDKQTLQVKEMDTIYFILDVLKRHEQEFNRLITKLREVTEQLRETEKVIDRIDEID